MRDIQSTERLREMQAIIAHADTSEIVLQLGTCILEKVFFSGDG